MFSTTQIWKMDTGFKYDAAPGRSLIPKTFGSTSGAGKTMVVVAFLG